MKRKIVGIIVLSLMLGVVGCSDSQPTESSVEALGFNIVDETRLTSPVTIDANPITPSRETEETTVDTSEGNSEETSYTTYTQQTDAWEYGVENDVSQLVVPNHSFAQNRVVTGDDTLLCYDGTMRIDDNGVFDVTYTDWHDNTTHSGSFILDGIIVPSCPDGSCFENPTINLGFINVVRHICGRDGIAVYVDTDGQTDTNGNYHGYIYFSPVIDDVNRGRVLYGEELVQLNEWLLAYGFAAPDHSYYGEYAEIYAQYPDFADDFEGYPLMVAAYLTEPNDYNFFFYNPHASTQALSEMGY